MHVLLQLAVFVLATSKEALFSQAHTQLGLHGLSQDDPSGAPTLPAIEGFFEVEIKVRFTNPTGAMYQNLFEYNTADDKNNIFFGQVFDNTAGNIGPVGDAVQLLSIVDGDQKRCIASNSANVNQVYKYTFSIDETETATIRQDGNLLVSCPGFQAPLNVPRNHFIGRGTFDVRFNDVERTRGAILGLRVTNLPNVQHPREAHALQNFPGQTFDSLFVASFYARFDDTSRFGQRVFDFGNGQADNNILCGQFIATKDMVCAVYRNALVFLVIARDAIIQNEYAFWHFGAELVGGGDWNLYIEKDGSRMAEQAFTINLPNVFRKRLRFGESNFSFDSDLEGVVLGFRLDRGIVS